eukprot:5775581-Pleurochrysis_carterae.AAC.1
MVTIRAAASSGTAALNGATTAMFIANTVMVQLAAFARATMVVAVWSMPLPARRRTAFTVTRRTA